MNEQSNRIGKTENCFHSICNSLDMHQSQLHISLRLSVTLDNTAITIQVPIEAHHFVKQQLQKPKTQNKVFHTTGFWYDQSRSQHCTPCTSFCSFSSWLIQRFCIHARQNIVMSHIFHAPRSQHNGSGLRLWWDYLSKMAAEQMVSPHNTSSKYNQICSDKTILKIRFPLSEWSDIRLQWFLGQGGGMQSVKGEKRRKKKRDGAGDGKGMNYNTIKSWLGMKLQQLSFQNKYRTHSPHSHMQTYTHTDIIPTNTNITAPLCGT